MANGILTNQKIRDSACEKKRPLPPNDFDEVAVDGKNFSRNLEAPRTMGQF
jgi:hypothetical protein